jgi:arylsulfatase A-like enzyme
MNFQAVSVGQKLKNGGYSDVLGTPTANLNGEIDFVDSSLGLFVNELKKNNLLDSTLIIFGVKHGQSPIDLSKRQAIPGSAPQTVVGAPYVSTSATMLP